MHYFVTGGCGFIGSNMVDRLLKNTENTVTVYDNLSTGRRAFLADAENTNRLRLVIGDTLDAATLENAMRGADFVMHFAANADVRMGVEHPGKDLEQNTIATYNVLEGMRKNGVRRLMFSSTGSVYGEATVIPTPEDAPFPAQTSLYGASKLACEGMIEAYCEGFDMQSYIFRFVSILGERYTHGHVFDFVKRLSENPDTLHILGNGHQKKSYLYVGDCINAILLAIEKSDARINLFNLGVDGYCEVNDSARWISQRLSLSPSFTYAGGDRGWIGDNPFIYLDTKRIRALGWAPERTIEESVKRTVDYLVANPWVFDRA